MTISFMGLSLMRILGADMGRKRDCKSALPPKSSGRAAQSGKRSASLLRYLPANAILLQSSIAPRGGTTKP
jgi:hypothetical protein